LVAIKTVVVILVVLLLIDYLVTPNLTLYFVYSILSAFVAFGVKKQTDLDLEKSLILFGFASLLVPFFVLLLYYQYISGIPSSQVSANLTNYLTAYLTNQFPAVIVGALGGIIAESFLSLFPS